MTAIQNHGAPSGNSWGAGLNNFLSDKRPAILKRWVDAVLSTYQPETSSFIRKTENRFANPVGHTLTHCLTTILDNICAGRCGDDMAEALDGLVRIRAVQDFAPSEAVSFVFALKGVIRSEISKDPKISIPYEDMALLDGRIDDVALVSFDIFMKCREKLYEIKANEMKRMTYRLIEKANKVCGGEAEDTSPSDRDADNIKKEEVTK